MKNEGISNLIKDVLLAVIAWGICACLLNALWTGTVYANDAMMGAVLFAGIPFGWRWSSKIITAVSLKGVLIKLMISLLLGWFAIFVVLIFDIIGCFVRR